MWSSLLQRFVECPHFFPVFEHTGIWANKYNICQNISTNRLVHFSGSNLGTVNTMIKQFLNWFFKIKWPRKTNKWLSRIYVSWLKEYFPVLTTNISSVVLLKSWSAGWFSHQSQNKYGCHSQSHSTLSDLNQHQSPRWEVITLYVAIFVKPPGRYISYSPIY